MGGTDHWWFDGPGKDDKTCDGGFPHKLLAPRCRGGLTIDLIGHHNARNLRPELPQLCIPGAEVPVRDFPLHIEHHDAGVGLVVVGGVHALEPLLACCVPKVHKDGLAVYRGRVLVQGQGVCGQLLGLTAFRLRKTMNKKRRKKGARGGCWCDGMEALLF